MHLSRPLKSSERQALTVFAVTEHLKDLEVSAPSVDTRQLAQSEREPISKIIYTVFQKKEWYEHLPMYRTALLISSTAITYFAACYSLANQEQRLQFDKFLRVSVPLKFCIGVSLIVMEKISMHFLFSSQQKQSFIDKEKQYWIRKRKPWENIVSAILKAPIREEIEFRAIKQNGIQFALMAIGASPSFASKISLVASSLLFGAAHRHNFATLPKKIQIVSATTISGIALGLCYQKFGLFGSIALHSLHNASLLILPQLISDCETFPSDNYEYYQDRIIRDLQAIEKELSPPQEEFRDWIKAKEQSSAVRKIAFGLKAVP